MHAKFIFVFAKVCPFERYILHLEAYLCNKINSVCTIVTLLMKGKCTGVIPNLTVREAMK